MKPLKTAYQKLCSDWLINSPRSYTKAGNFRSPGYAVAIEWINKILYELDEDIVRSSFKSCGVVSNDLEHFHDQLAHFMRSNQFTNTVEEGTELNEIDGFGDFFQVESGRGSDDDDE